MPISDGQVKTLIDSELRYRRLFESARDGILIVDFDGGRIIDANPFLTKISGYSHNELVGKKLWEIGSFKNIVRSKTAFRGLKTKGDIRHEDIPLETKDGRRRNVEFVTSVYALDGTKLIQCNIRDITERTKAEEAMRESEQRYRLLIEKQNDGLCIVDFEERFLFCNPAGEEIFGVPRGGLVGRNTREFTTPETFDFIRKQTEKRRSGESSTYELEIIRPDGERRQLLATATPWLDKDGRVNAALAIFRDETDRRRAQREIRTQVDLLQKTLDSMSDAVFILDARLPAPTIIECNQAAPGVFGYDRAEVLGKTTKFLHVSEETLREFQSQLYRAVQQGQLPFHLQEFRMKRKDGSIFPSEHSVSQLLNDKGERTGWVSIVRDITQRKRMEEEIRGLARFPSENPNPVLRLNESGAVLVANPASEPLLREWGSEAERVAPKFWRALVAEALSTQRDKNVDVEFGGRSYTFLVRPAKEIGCVNLYGRDITERKRAEEALRASEARYRAIVNEQTELICRFLPGGTFTFVNEAYCRYFNKKSEELIGQQFMPLAQEDHENVRRQRASTSPEKPVMNYEQRVLLPNGEIRWQEWRDRAIFDEQRRLIEFQSVGRDITERKRAREQYETIVHTAMEGFWKTDTSGRFLDVNDAYCRMIGYSRDELLKMRIQDLEAQENAEETARHIKTIMETGSDRFETRHRHKDGKLIDVEVSTTYLPFDGGQLVVFLRGITERKQMMQEVLKSRQFLLSIIHNANVWLDVIDEKGNVLIWNEAAEVISGYSRKEVAGHGKIWEWLYPDPQYRQEVMRTDTAIIEQGKAEEDFQTRIRCKDGQTRIISWNSRNLLDENHRSIGSIAIGQDVTERKKAEDALRASEFRYRTLFEKIPHAIYQTTREGGLLAGNPAFVRMLGYESKEEITIDVAHNVYANPEDRNTWMRRIEEKEEVRDFELPLRRKDGSKIIVLDTAHAVRDDRGTLLYYEGTLTDITERKRMEERLRSLHEHALQLGSASDMDQIVKYTLDAMEYALGFDFASFCLIENGYAVVRGHRGLTFLIPRLVLDGSGVIVKVANSRRALRISDTRREPDYVDRMGLDWAGSPSMLSELAVAVVIENEAVAVLDVESTRLDAFTDQDQRLLETLASHVASALSRLKHEQEMEEYSERLEELVEARTTELKVSEQKYHRLVDNISDVVFTIDLEGKFTYVSPSAETMTQYPVSQLLSMNMKTVIAPDHYPRIMERLRARTEGEKIPPQIEFEIIRADGGRLPVEMRTSPILSEEGVIIGVQGIVRDIAERKEIENRLRDSEEKFRRICDTSLDGIYTATLDGRIVDMSPAGVAMFGFDSLEEIRKVNIKSLYAQPKDRERLIELAHKGPVKGHDVLFRRKDGSPLHCILNTYPLKDENGEIVAFQGAIVDVTERKKMEEALAASRERLEYVIALNPAVIFTSKPRADYSDYDATYMSESVFSMLGYRAREVAGHPDFWENHVHPEDKLRFASELPKLWKEGHYEGEYRLLHKDGQYRWIREEARVVRDAAGNPKEVIGCMTDVTEKKRMEKMKGQFTSAVTHELRTPIVSIQGYLDLALKTDLRKETLASLQVAKRNTDRLLRLTSDLLDIQRMQMGKMQLVLKPVDFVDFMDNCLTDIMPMTNAKKQVLQHEIPRTPIHISGDAARLSQAVMNVLDNASKFSPEGGRIMARVQDAKDQRRHSNL